MDWLPRVWKREICDAMRKGVGHEGLEIAREKCFFPLSAAIFFISTPFKKGYLDFSLTPLLDRDGQGVQKKCILNEGMRV